ncbi:DUF2613 domain-containing protein [Hoyosella rhizosphaerae]|uniref:DUF2613 domain-containing protein n=1 Tax=Hoyosella rhizosphaerae TaxID=1755582 RepID=A0A916U7N1_9ACTN|nr:DUF2613 domain-containing protein [Hoyosella rhizosphaerae]MBN4927683.1 DUF2613 domain-containing protein [Hoyosella rhizosphaerae]GGC62502.1 hypothetical protein GCM10011410_13680 [Hoyosella rhizosphaerae]
MKFLIPGAIAAFAGTTFAFVLVIAGTSFVEQNTRPDIDRAEQAQVALLNQPEYGSR